MRCASMNSSGVDNIGSFVMNRVCSGALLMSSLVICAYVVAVVGESSLLKSESSISSVEGRYNASADCITLPAL